MKTRFKKNDGNELIIQTSYLPYYQNETFQGILVCSSDITERKLAEKAIKESEAERARLRLRQKLELNRETNLCTFLQSI